MKFFKRLFGVCFVIFLSLPGVGLSMDKVDGKTVLITGANRGIGLEFAKQYSDLGYLVIGTARKPDEAIELKATGARVEQLDVTDSESVKALAEKLRGVKIDILINNAGVLGPYAPSFSKQNFDEMAFVLDVNSLGPMRVTQALYENLKQGEDKKVVHISSYMGSITLTKNVAIYGYRASKAALNMFNKVLSNDLGPEGFVCVVLHPGGVETDMNPRGALKPAESVGSMIKVIDNLDAASSGGFYNYDGDELPW